jgi:hypothetical protein
MVFFDRSLAGPSYARHYYESQINQEQPSLSFKILLSGGFLFGQSIGSVG